MAALDPFTFALFLLAVYRLTRLITTDTFPFEPARRFIVRRWPSDDDRFGEGEIEHDPEGPHVRGLPKVRLIGITEGVDVWYYAERPRKLGELVQCPWCMGMWVSAAVFAWWQWGNPDPVAWVFGIASGSAAAGLLARWAE